MGKIKSFFGIRKFTTKDICTLGIFIALTIVLTLYFTLRVGKEIEISFNFIPIIVIAALYGPFFAGVTALAADVISVYAMPVGPIIPALCVTAFFSGVIYGLLLYRDYSVKVNMKVYVLKMVICVLLQFALSVLVNSYILYWTYGTKDFTFWFLFRFPASFVKIFMQAAVIMVAPPFLKIFSKKI